jgi:hypothetical protein
MWSFISLIYLSKERVGRRKEYKQPLETARRCRIYTSAVQNGWWMFRKSHKFSLFCLRHVIAPRTSCVMLELLVGANLHGADPIHCRVAFGTDWICHAIYGDFDWCLFHYLPSW